MRANLAPHLLTVCFGVLTLSACPGVPKDSSQTQDQAGAQTSQAPSLQTDSQPSSQTKPFKELRSLTVYSSKTCGCCKRWVKAAQDNGFLIEYAAVSDLSELKKSLGVEAVMQSCHTSVSDTGLVFEGHIPPEIIQTFLTNPVAEARGLSVPGMPVGSPGMEAKDAFMPYTVYALFDSKDPEPYAQVDAPNQFELVQTRTNPQP